MRWPAVCAWSGTAILPEQPMSATSPCVSVVIPTRNCLDYLPDAIASIGPEPTIEIVVVDDGSTDGTDAWLAEAARRDHRIRVIAGPGTGVSGARNAGVAAARAPLLAFLDADDVWLPGKLAHQTAFHAVRPDVVFSFTDYRHVGADGRDLGTCFAFWPGIRGRLEPGGWTVMAQALPVLLAENVAGTSTVMVKRDELIAVGGFDGTLEAAEDWDAWLKLSARGPVAASRREGTRYLVRPGSTLRQYDRLLAALPVVIARHGNGPDLAGSRRAAQARLASARAEEARRRGRPATAVRHRIGALFGAPSRRGMRDLLSDAAAMVTRRS
ncbi:hypothetical protein STAQ_10050 [Allostella sp. ATCC 35155]|nr:hypothetical protein STAQ_10050 [Stella sp. ATCC 35155]